MSKPSNDNIAKARLTADNIRLNLLELKRTGNTRKACFSIIAGKDGEKGNETKLAIRDSRLDQFETIFNQALSLKPDFIIIKQFTGDAANAIEIPDSQNIIRIAPYTKKSSNTSKTLQGAEVQYPQSAPLTDTALTIRQTEFECNMKLQNQEMAHNQTIRDFENNIKDLQKKLDELQEKNQAHEKLISELETELTEKESQQLGSAKTLLQAGIMSLADMASKNPEAKFLGIIPNRLLMGLGGTPGEAALPDPNGNYQHSAEISQVSDYLRRLSEDDFNKVFSVFGYMYVNPQNINTLVELIQSPSATPQPPKSN